jgi:tetratricopeptide (TPR) repeat protein
MMGRHEDALIELDRCLELDPEEEDGYEFRAKAFAALGRFDEALTDVNRAIELSSGDSDLYGLRSEVYGALGRYEEAAADRDARERLMAMYEALPARR